MSLTSVRIEKVAKKKERKDNRLLGNIYYVREGINL